MERDIHRMRMRYEAVKRDQERLVSEMERAIEKREIISMKNKSANALTVANATTTGKVVLGNKMAATATGAGTGVATKVGLRHRAGQLRKEIEAKLHLSDEVEEALVAKQAEVEEVLSLVNDKADDVRQLEAQVTAIQKTINACLYEKQKGVETVSALTRLLQRLEALETGRLPPLTAEESTKVLDKLAEAESSRNSVRRLIAQLAGAHTELAEVLNRVSQLIDIAPGL
jgi:chromosome segregation ATPase